MKGDRVIVRADGGAALVRRVWAADDQAVYIADETTLGRLEAGEKGPLPIGFPREDVFRYEPKVAERIGKPGWTWKSLTPYGGRA